MSRIPGALRLPRASVRLLENVVRRAATDEEAVRQAWEVVSAGLEGRAGGEVDFWPARVLFQDFTGVPIFVDFAAMRDAVAADGGDPTLVNPRIPCVLVVDHSVCADVAGCADAAFENQRIEARRNAERFSFLKWAGASFDNVQIVPPGQGICHQLNVEVFSPVVAVDALHEGEELACFDTLVGSDSHTTTANGIGVLGWGVGGIEAEAAALGQPLPMRVPEVVELRLTGQLPDGAQAMDLALTVAKLLRETGVVGSIVEVTGDGVAGLTVPQRACVANMSPEYGSTAVLFPVDEQCVDYLRLTGRPEDEVRFVEAYYRAEGCWGLEGARVYGRTVELDLGTVRPCLAGPSRPHNQVFPEGLRERFRAVAEQNGHGDFQTLRTVPVGASDEALGHGALAIAAITSCTTATDPAMMVAAGLTAQKALDAGLEPKPWVKKVLAPGSHAASLLLERAGLAAPLARLGFETCGHGCMSCIGNSGPVLPGMHEAAEDLELASVLSGNRNFDGRISPDVAQNYLASPALVVAYSLAGTVDVDLSTEPVGIGADGEPVMLSDLLPSAAEVQEVLDAVLSPSLYEEGTAGLFDGDAAWRLLPDAQSDTFPWDPTSTYIRRPPYFEIARPCDSWSLDGARCLALLPDFVTTDHISPAGAIAPDSPAARYLEERGVAPEDFNTYGSRRGNHEVMERGTFANVRLENRLADGRRGGYTRDLLTGEVVPVWDAADHYGDAPLVVVAGKMYGSGSSRDWAAKGPVLQGVRAVIAESFERIHRSNLVGMGIVPLELADVSLAALGLDGTEAFSVAPFDLSVGGTVTVRAVKADGEAVEFPCRVRVDTETEAGYLRKGGILPYVLDQIAH